MNINAKLNQLDRIYSLFDDFTAGLDLACEKGCAVCCTRNVTLTSLEGRYLLDRVSSDFKKELIARLTEASGLERFIPRITTNQLARLCRDGMEIPDETVDPAWTPCPLLENDLCRVYTLRPLGCRALMSTRPCRSEGFAHVIPFALTVMNVFMQYIEHLDAPGVFANLTDMLPFLNEFPSGDGQILMQNADQRRMAFNLPIPLLMIPPEHQERIRPLIHALQGIRPAPGRVV